MLHDRIRKDCAIPRKITFRNFFKAGILRDRYFSLNSDILLLFRKGFVNCNVNFR
jgi:hypothetical protein